MKRKPGRVAAVNFGLILLMVTLLMAGCKSTSAVAPQQVPARPIVSAIAPSPPAVSAPEPLPSALTASEAAAEQTTIDRVPSPSKEQNVMIRVYYATDRSRSSQSVTVKSFGNKPGTLSYGSCDISISKDHKMPQPDTQSILRFKLGTLPGKHVVVSKISPREYTAYMGNLKREIAKSTKKNAFVFVHGYNATFADAVRRTAQIKYELGFDGAPICFSWPSKGKSDAYPADEAIVEWAQPDLRAFLKDVAAQSKAKNVFLIAHGLGTRALTKAYSYLISERPELKNVFREVILLEPDI